MANKKVDKVEKYIRLIAKKYPMAEFEVVESQRSNYFNFNGRVMRVSDHIGANSSGHFSIIKPDMYGGDDYIMHMHKTGKLTIMTYEQVKKFIESFVMCSKFMDVVEQPGISCMVDKADSNSVKTSNGYILGIPESDFSSAQINQIRTFINQNTRSKKKK